jgi:predicted GNAT superfamily acetyltransferase
MRPDVEIRALTAIAEFRDVIALEREIWGGEPEDAVGIPIFAVTLKRGGLLLGAYEGDRLAGFAYSLAAMKAGRPVQWSHMLGVQEGFRATGLGRALKLAQRQHALAAGFDLMEWTFDPLQAVNAHLNVRRLGVVADEYLLNVYGESTSPLHGAVPTDRLVAQWWMETARVARILAGTGPAASLETPAAPVLRAVSRGGWTEPAGVDLGRQDAAVAVEIPGGFGAWLDRDPGLASAWRAATRAVFSHYLGRGFRVVDFGLDHATGGGTYRLASSVPE